MTMEGMYGHPRSLVTAATRRLCDAIKAGKPGTPVRYVLMNSAASSNRDLAEPVSSGHGFVIRLLRLLPPPHVDNEQAAGYLLTGLGQDASGIE